MRILKGRETADAISRLRQSNRRQNAAPPKQEIRTTFTSSAGGRKGSAFLFLALRFGDLVWRRQLQSAFALDKWSLLFLFETALILIPAVALRSRVVRETPRTLLNMATLACLGGMFYRFVPTTIAFTPARNASYFPSLPEVLMAVGYISLGITAFAVAVKYFAVLPGDVEDWNYKFRPVRGQRAAAGSEGETPCPASL